MTVRRQMRRALTLALWGVTPWRLAGRLRSLRNRGRPLRDFAQDPATLDPLDLADDEEIARCAGLPRSEIIWPPQAVETITDARAAARWVVDLLRWRQDLRSRFDFPLGEGADGRFRRWLCGEGGDTLGLSPAARGFVAEAFRNDPAARARQYFFWREDLRADLPLALLPVGRRGLAAMMLRHRSEGGITLEEVWWFLLRVSENPRRELIRTFLFTPRWQRACPHGLTNFGAEALAAWLVATYALDPAKDWLDWRCWPVGMPAVEHFRLAYDAIGEWQTARPDAFATPAAASDFLRWLSTPEAGLRWQMRTWCEQRLEDGTPERLAAPGINVIGHYCYPSGLRVSVNALSNAAEQAGVGVSRRDIRTDLRDDPCHDKMAGLEVYDVTILHVQPEPFFPIAYARADLAERHRRTYRIAYWYWEFETVPASWAAMAESVDEVWVATEFVANALRPVSPVPVCTLFPGVEIGTFRPRSRRAFGLPAREDGRFAFLFSFHTGSVMERKNPLGLIRAFREAFAPDEPVDLVLKTTSFGSNGGEAAALLAAAAGHNIQVIDRIFTTDETLSLMDACDAYVSLHRSEGLGLTMAEAMLLGKPVIATAYSGNLDFMDAENSLLIDYALIPMAKPLPPYDGSYHWAEPSIEQAARSMRRLYDDQAWGRALGLRAQKEARSRLSLDAAGARIRQRLEAIEAAGPGRQPTASRALPRSKG